MSGTKTKKKTIVFYSQEELNTIKAYAHNGQKTKKNVNALVKLLGRPRSGVYAKYLGIKKELKKDTLSYIPEAATPGKLNLEAKKIVHVPKGMIMEFPASRVHIEEGKITLYF